MSDQVQKDTRFLSGYVYHNEKYKNNQGFQLLNKEEDKKSGFYAEAYYKNKRVYVVYRGTENVFEHPVEGSKDITNDRHMASGNMPSQLIHARNFYNYVARKYRNYPIYATGHSLGGSLAQIVASTTKELKAYTYNAYGTKQIKGFNPKYPENVTNYGNAKDEVFSRNIDNHVGKTLVIDENPSERKSLNKYHAVEYIGDTDKAKEYKPQKTAQNNTAQPKSKLNKVHEMIAKHEEKLKSKKSSKQKNSNSSKSGGGRWVTMNGRHVYLPD